MRFIDPSGLEPKKTDETNIENTADYETPNAAVDAPTAYFLFPIYQSTDAKTRSATHNEALDEMKKLEDSGYKVIVKYDASKKEILDAIADDSAKIILIHPHGSLNSPKIFDGNKVSLGPKDVKKVGKNLEVIAILSCHQTNNNNLPGWKSIFSKQKIIGYDRAAYNPYDHLSYLKSGNDKVLYDSDSMTKSFEKKYGVTVGPTHGRDKTFDSFMDEVKSFVAARTVVPISKNSLNAPNLNFVMPINNTITNGGL